MSINSARRRRLHAENPNCHWCGVLTVLEAPTPRFADLATVDHVIDRHQARELGMTNEERNQHVVLACNRCNQRRAKMGLKGHRPVLKPWHLRRRR